MRIMGSLVLDCADATRVPGGSALTVDRNVFAETITQRITSHPLIEIVREEVAEVTSPSIVATGPLTSDRLSGSIRERTGSDALSFYDAIAPIVSFESVDHSIAFRASRYGKETMEGAGDEGAYLNCPMNREEYEAFLDALTTADQYRTHDFDQVPYFEGCMPIEVMAQRGRETLRFGPMKPVGLDDPRTGRRPWAVVQLRQEDRAGVMWNLVGFQTRLRIPEQQRVFRMIPALANAEFFRYGQIHRNAYLNAPACLTPHLSLRDDPAVVFAGQLTGVEGYTESTATGILAGINMLRVLRGEDPVVPPPTTMIGALYRYLREADVRHFQPMNANFGLVEPLADEVRDKRRKKELLAERALVDIASWRDRVELGTPAAAS
jgi:methylenetetrahydrofolate--tRNA-(uracil-5-)-methyltransferase